MQMTPLVFFNYFTKVGIGCVYCNDVINHWKFMFNDRLNNVVAVLKKTHIAKKRTMTKQAAASNENPQHVILFTIAYKEMMREMLFVCSSNASNEIVSLYKLRERITNRSLSIIDSVCSAHDRLMLKKKCKKYLFF